MKYVHTNGARGGEGIFKHLLLHHRLQHAQHICFFVVSGMCKFVSLIHGIIFDDLFDHLISCLFLCIRWCFYKLSNLKNNYSGYSIFRGKNLGQVSEVIVA